MKHRLPASGSLQGTSLEALNLLPPPYVACLSQPHHLRSWSVMSKLAAADTSLQHPLWTLTAIWLFWKTALVGIVLASPGPDYDTSTTLLDWQRDHSFLAKFIRWDAIYFTQTAQHGHVFEQQWAFGIGISSVLDWTSRGECSPAPLLSYLTACSAIHHADPHAVADHHLWLTCCASEFLGLDGAGLVHRGLTFSR